MSALETVLFKSLADPTRRGLFERLAREGEMTVVALTREAHVSQPAVSQHLAVLKEAGLVADRREGRTTHYRAAPEGLAPITGWLAAYGVFWTDRIDRLETLLNEMDQ
ncbi:MAG: bacterial regulatory, arsR family protein [Caulobacter sp.]|nr:bacterial regulatory, arsR family protein [Caulobacter sp.]